MQAAPRFRTRDRADGVLQVAQCGPLNALVNQYAQLVLDALRYAQPVEVGKERRRLGIDDIALVLQQNRLRWYGHVLRKDDDYCVKKCMEYEVEGPRPRGRPKRTWRDVVREDCQACKLNKEDAMDRCKWRKMIKHVR